MHSAKLILIVVAVMILATSSPVGAGWTEKTLSTNHSLVNLHDGANAGIEESYWPDGSKMMTPGNTFSMTYLGDQAIFRQYEDLDLPEGRGSAVFTASGKLGVVVQIQALGGQIGSSGAYSGIVGSSATVGVPLLAKQLATASGIANSQIIVQNASENRCDMAVDLVDARNGGTTKTQIFGAVPSHASLLYDLSDDSELPDGWYGSASVRATTPGCTLAAISNLFMGEHGLQTFNTFSTPGEVWSFPLFASRLDNGLSIPITVQNQSGQDIPLGGVRLACVKDHNSPGPKVLQAQNEAVVKNQASAFFNPVINSDDFPDDWYGACRLESPGYATVAFAQMRIVGTDMAAAYEGIGGDSTAKTIVLPLFAKRLSNGFATAITIQNLSETGDAYITLTYRQATGFPTECGATFNATIPPGGSLIQNHRLSEGPGSVPELGERCFGSLLVTSYDQPIAAVVQLTFLPGTPGDSLGDTFMAHNAFTTEEVVDTTVHLPLSTKKWSP